MEAPPFSNLEEDDSLFINSLPCVKKNKINSLPELLDEQETDVSGLHDRSIKDSVESGIYLQEAGQVEADVVASVSDCDYNNLCTATQTSQGLMNIPLDPPVQLSKFETLLPPYATDSNNKMQGIASGSRYEIEDNASEPKAETDRDKKRDNVTLMDSNPSEGIQDEDNSLFDYLNSLSPLRTKKYDKPNAHTWNSLGMEEEHLPFIFTTSPHVNSLDESISLSRRLLSSQTPISGGNSSGKTARISERGNSSGKAASPFQNGQSSHSANRASESVRIDQMTSEAVPSTSFPTETDIRSCKRRFPFHLEQEDDQMTSEDRDFISNRNLQLNQRKNQ